MIIKLPDWRFVEVQRDISLNRLPELDDDPFKKILFSFLKKVYNQYDEKYLNNKYPNLFAAYKIYKLQNNDYKLLLEAKLLTRRPTTFLAFDLKISEDIINWYTKLFFDVKPNLNNESYIFSFVLAESLAKHGYSEKNKDFIWKFFAYVGGDDALNSVVFGKDPDKIMKMIKKEFLTTIQYKALFASKFTSSAINPNLFIETVCKLAEDNFRDEEKNISDIINSISTNLRILDKSNGSTVGSNDSENIFLRRLNHEKT